MKKTIFILSLVIALSSCGGGSNEPATTDSVKTDSVTVTDSTVVVTDSSVNGGGGLGPRPEKHEK